MHPLPTLTRNRGPGHEGLAVLWTPCRRGGPDHTASAATGWQGTKTRSKRSNSPELLADWDPQPGSLEQDPPALRRAEDGWRTFRICGRHGGQGGRGQEGAGERQTSRQPVDPGISKPKTGDHTTLPERGSRHTASTLPGRYNQNPRCHMESKQKTPEGGGKAGWPGPRRPREGR